MRPLFIVGQICPNPFRHNDHERAIGHVDPVVAANKFVRSVPYEGTIRIDG